MRKYYTEHNYKIWLRITKKKQAKRSAITSRKKKERNRLKYTIRKADKKIELEKRKHKVIKAPAVFSVINNPEKFIKFINRLEGFRKERQSAFIEMEHVEQMDYTAVTVLLSIMFSFKENHVDFNGDFPKIGHLKQMLIDSDFFKYLKRQSTPKKAEYILGKKNQIFTRGYRDVNAELGKLVMEEASITIWGEKRACKGLQRVLIELMQNTNNHADKSGKGKKFWWLSVNHDKENKKVSFVFVDYGIGIFESLYNKPRESKWYDWFTFFLKSPEEMMDNREVFQLLLDGSMHQTVTGKHFRGKGLPGVKECFDRHQISNLFFVSNNVFADITNDNFKILNKHFSGTFVYWELDENNKNIPWTID